MKDYEKTIKTYFLCAPCSKVHLEPGETLRPATSEEISQESCCTTGSYSEYYGSGSQQWYCDNTVAKALEVEVLVPC